MKSKKVLAAILSMMIILDAIPVQMFSITVFAQGGSFYASFEADEDFSNFAEGSVERDEEGMLKAYGMKTERVVGEYIGYWQSITGSADYKASEAVTNLIDRNPATKYLTNANTPSESTPIWAEMVMTEEIVVRAYSMTAANDEQRRDPKNWTLYGSADGTDWNPLDTQSNQVFAARQSTNYYEFDNETAYQYYRLEITANFGNSSMTQFADVAFGSNVDNGETTDALQAAIGTGPGSTINGVSNKGWTGDKALTVWGVHDADDHAYSYNVVYSDLNIPVGENTQLSYMIFPDFDGSYDNHHDYDYTSMYMSVDLHFTDGSYLSELGAVDQNGHIVSPTAQGESRILFYRQWNHIYSNIGDVAAGRTIDRILVAYENPKEHDTAPPLNIRSYFDDITIETVEPVEHDRLSDYVNILRGTNDSTSFSRGLTGPMVTVPHGFNFWAPSTSGDSNSIYNYQTASANKLRDITVSHQPSYWIGDRGTFQFMMNTSIDTPTEDNTASAARAVAFSHENEIAKAHYYSVIADEDDANAGGAQMEVTPASHAAVVRFTFPEDAAKRNVIFDSVRRTTGGSIEFSADGKSFNAYTMHTGNGMNRMYIYAELDTAASTEVVNSEMARGFIQFPAGTSQVTMKIATSFISAEQAKRNLQLEISDEDTFDTVKERAQAEWDDKLGIVEIEGATYDQTVTFYSNMYRLFAYPNLLSENTGTEENPDWKYASPYGSNRNSANPDIVDGVIYYNNGFWDTYRTTWAAYAFFTPTQNTELLNGLVQHFNDQTWVPRWIAPGGTDSMVGTSSDVIFGDAIMRGQEFDYENAYLSTLRNAASVSTTSVDGRKNLNTSIFLGYTANDLRQGMSWSIEGYINDFGISNMAKTMMENMDDKNSDEYRTLSDEYTYYRNRAQNYVNLFNADIGDGWFVGKDSSGMWSNTEETLLPIEWGRDYTETNAWNMVASVTQDGQGLANLYGGRDALGAKLDGVFETKGEFIQGDHSGIIHEQREAREVKMGQYGHNNQPSHHLPYMYLYAGQPWKTQGKVRDIMERLYAGESIGQGFSGDEDNGEMSAWYVLSSLGIYPVNMGSGEFAIGSPLFTKATVHMENGEDLVINAPNNSRENIYVQSVKLNDKDWDKAYFDHADIAYGGVIDFDMADTPSTWGSSEEALPTSLTTGDEVPQPMSDLLPTSPVELTSAPTQNQPYNAVYISESANTVRYLFDNNSANTTTISAGSASIYFSFANAKAVDMYTITSGSDTAQAPKNWMLWGSDDNQNWTKLDERSNQEFQWAKYTRPFGIEGGASYRNYRLDITATNGASTINIAELEFLGISAEDGLKDELQSLLLTANSQDTSKYAPSTVQVLEDAVQAAQAVYDNDGATVEEIQAAITALTAALDGLIETRTGLGTIEAESYNTSIGDIKKETTSNTNDGTVGNVGGTADGLWFSFIGLDFGRKGVKSISVRYAASANSSSEDARLEVRLGSPEGEMVTTIETKPTASSGWLVYETSSADVLQKLTGVQDIYIVTRGSGKHVCNINWFFFEEDEDAQADKTDLELLYALYEPYLDNEYKYTEDSFAPFKTAMDTAKALLDDPQANQDDIDNAVDILKQAAAGLVIGYDGYGKFEAEARSSWSGGDLKVENSTDSALGQTITNIGGTYDGAWIAYENMNFSGNGMDTISVRYVNNSSRCGSNSRLELRLDAPDGELVDTVPLPVTASNWNGYGTTIYQMDTAITGTHDLYIIMRSDTTSSYPYVGNFDWFHFQEAEEAPVAPDTNKRILEATIQYAQKQDLDYVNVIVAGRFTEALNNAIAVFEDEYATQAEIDKAAEDLLGMIHMLGYTSDPRELQELVGYAQTIKDNLDQYKETGKQEFLDALENAQEVLDEITSLDADYEAAHERLMDAIEALELKPALDTSQLEKMIDKADAIAVREDEYLSAGWDAFIAELARAKDILENSEDQNEIDAAALSLYDTILNLRLKPNKDLLAQLLNRGYGVNASLYTVPSLEALNIAIINGQKTLNNEEATQDEVTKASRDIDSALEALVSLDAESNGSTGQDTAGNTQAENETANKSGNANPKTSDTTEAGMFLWIVAAVISMQVFRKRKQK